MLLDPDDVAAGHVVRFRRAAPDRVVRSRRPAHPAIVSVETFTRAQVLRRSRAAGGLEARRKLERGPRAAKRPYMLRGRVRCAHCQRRMEGTPKHNREYYRCVARTLTPGSAALATHPRNVYLPEHEVVAPLNAWLGGLFAPENLDATVAALLDSQSGGGLTATTVARDAARARLEEAETRLRRLRAAVEAGVDPTALVESINDAQAQCVAARAEVDAAATTELGVLTDAEVYAMIDSLGDIGEALNSANPDRLRSLYEQLRLEMIYDGEARTADVVIRPSGGIVSVSEGGLELPRRRCHPVSAGAGRCRLSSAVIAVRVGSWCPVSARARPFVSKWLARSCRVVGLGEVTVMGRRWVVALLAPVATARPGRRSGVSGGPAWVMIGAVWSDVAGCRSPSGRRRVSARSVLCGNAAGDPAGVMGVTRSPSCPLDGPGRRRFCRARSRGPAVAAPGSSLRTGASVVGEVRARPHRRRVGLGVIYAVVADLVVDVELRGRICL
jgi:hypothetical protein